MFHKKPSKFFVIVLCFMLVLTFSFSMIQEVQANPAIVLSASVLATVGSLLLAQGVQFQSNDGLNSTVADFLYKNSILGLYDKVKDVPIGSAFTITADVASALWDYVHNSLPQAMSNPYDVSYTVDGSTSEAVSSTKFYTSATGFIPSATGYISIYYQSLSELGTPYSSTTTQKSVTAGHLYSITFIPYTASDNFSTFKMVDTTDGHTVISNGPGTASAYTQWASFTIADLAGQMLNSSLVDMTTPVGNSISLDTTQRETPLANDTVTTIGADTLVGANTSDLVITQEQILDQAATQTGILEGILEGVLTIGSTITSSITGTFLGDSTGTINWEPIKVAGTLFTTKFPFSLPWDLLNAFQALGTHSSSAPVIPIDVETSIFKWHTTLDFSLFDPVVPTIRSLIMIGFGLTLVFGTRKLLGGAT